MDCICIINEYVHIWINDNKWIWQGFVEAGLYASIFQLVSQQRHNLRVTYAATTFFPDDSHLSRLVRDLQWWQRVFWNSSFRLGFLTWWRCLTQCLDRWASTTVNEERVGHVVAVFVLQSFLWGLWRNRSETDWFWCFHLPLRFRWMGSVWCLPVQCALGFCGSKSRMPGRILRVSVRNLGWSLM